MDDCFSSQFVFNNSLCCLWQYVFFAHAEIVIARTVNVSHCCCCCWHCVVMYRTGRFVFYQSCVILDCWHQDIMFCSLIENRFWAVEDLLSYLHCLQRVVCGGFLCLVLSVWTGWLARSSVCQSVCLLLSLIFVSVGFAVCLSNCFCSPVSFCTCLSVSLSLSVFSVCLPGFPVCLSLTLWARSKLCTYIYSQAGWCIDLII